MSDAAPLAVRLAAAGLDWIVPDWPAPPNVYAFSTTKNGEGGGTLDLGRRHADIVSARQLLHGDDVGIAPTQIQCAATFTVLRRRKRVHVRRRWPVRDDPVKARRRKAHSEWGVGHWVY